jgi:DNA-binding response OmpR family regulator
MPKQIFIIEDDEQLTDAMCEVLIDAGYQVTVCDNFADITSALPTSGVDLILLDIYLNEHDGRQIMAKLQSNPAYAAIPVVFVTVLNQQDLQDYKPAAVLTKSFGMHDLLDTVQKVIGH